MQLEEMKMGELLHLINILKSIEIKTEIVNEDGRYVIVRTYSAGVFAGYIESRNGREVIMRNARRLWQWSGAASLSQLSQSGTSDPDSCKFPCEVERVILTEAIEILDVTIEAEKSIKSVKVWTQ